MRIAIVIEHFDPKRGGAETYTAYLVGKLAAEGHEVSLFAEDWAFEPARVTMARVPVKGITAAQHIAKPGGRILVLGECAEGMGSPEFAHRMRTLTGLQDFLDEIRETPVEVDQWQLEKLALIGLNQELFFYTPGVSKTQLGSLGGQTFSDLDQAVAALLRGLPSGARVVLVPDGPYTYARAVPAYA